MREAARLDATVHSRTTTARRDRAMGLPTPTLPRGTAPAEGVPIKPTAAPVAQTAAKPENTADAAVAASGDATPQLVKRVHPLYEDLGREDVQAAQKWDKAHATMPAAKG